jgi:hypothetical protein
MVVRQLLLMAIPCLAMKETGSFSLVERIPVFLGLAPMKIGMDSRLALPYLSLPPFGCSVPACWG